MVKWNDLPWDEKASPEIKALEFDLQIAENAQAAEEPKTTVDEETSK